MALRQIDVERQNPMMDRKTEIVTFIVG